MTSSEGDHLEIERKYDAEAGFVLPDLGRLPELGGRRIAKPRRIYLSATYFDTEDFDLLRHKVTLRRRVGGDDEGWHLKLPVREDARQELHAPLGEGTDSSVPARLADQVEHHGGQAPAARGHPGYRTDRGQGARAAGRCPG